MWGWCGSLMQEKGWKLSYVNCYDDDDDAYVSQYDTEPFWIVYEKYGNEAYGVPHEKIVMWDFCRKKEHASLFVYVKKSKALLLLRWWNVAVVYRMLLICKWWIEKWLWGTKWCHVMASRGAMLRHHFFEAPCGAMNWASSGAMYTPGGVVFRSRPHGLYGQSMGKCLRTSLLWYRQYIGGC